MLSSPIGHAIQKVIIIAFFTAIGAVGLGLAQVFYWHVPDPDRTDRDYFEVREELRRKRSLENIAKESPDQLAWRFNLGAAIGGILGFVIGLRCKVDSGKKQPSDR